MHTDETTEESSYSERSLAAQFMTHDVPARYLYHLLMFLLGTYFTMFTEGDSGVTTNERAAFSCSIFAEHFLPCFAYLLPRLLQITFINKPYKQLNERYVEVTQRKVAHTVGAQEGVSALVYTSKTLIGDSFIFNLQVFIFSP